MMIFARSLWLVRLIAVVYALAMGVVGFSSSTHEAVLHQAPGIQLAATGGCHGATREGAPLAPQSPCCDACTLTSAPGLRAPSIAQVIYRTEVSTRFEFFFRLGHDLDDSPADIRSRAPPRPA